jgi:hypothetical protein
VETTAVSVVNDRRFLRFFWREMRAETRYYMKSLDLTILIITVLMMVSLAASKLPWWNVEGVALALVLGTSAPYIIAARVLLTHRTVDSIADTEIALGVQGWENFYKLRLFWGKFLLIPFNLTGSVPFTFMFGHANNQWYVLSLNGVHWWGAWVLFLSGMGVVLISPVVARK